MRAKNALAVLLLMGAGIAGTAQASVTSVMSGPTDIWAGSAAVFSATVTDIGPPSGYDWESISSVNYVFLSGDGRSWGGYVGGLSNSSVTLGAAFVYSTPGEYTPSFSAAVVTRAGYHYWVNTSFYTDYHHQDWYSYRCGWFSTCWASYWVGGWVVQGYTAYGVNDLQWGTNSATALTVREIPRTQTEATEVPEPFTLGILGIGLAVLGISRRKTV